ncbi:MAG: DUF4249 domain-containing protein [Bacteroidia bacterium]
MVLLFHSGCEQVVELEWPDQDPQLVINCLMEADSAIIAYANRSQGIQDTGEVKPVTDALMILRENGAIVDTMRHDSGGMYISPRGVIAVAGRSYTIEGSVAGLPSSTGTFTLPLAPTILNIAYRDSAYFEFGSYYDELSFDIDDPAGVADYYSFTGRAVGYEVIDTDTVLYEYDFYFVTSDPVLSSDLLSQGNMCEDQSFDGTHRRFRLKVGSDWHDVTPLMTISIAHCSESYFRYSQTLSAYFDASFNPFAEPVRVYSNMTPGMGVIGGKTKVSFPF